MGTASRDDGPESDLWESVRISEPKQTDSYMCYYIMKYCSSTALLRCDD